MVLINYKHFYAEFLFIIQLLQIATHIQVRTDPSTRISLGLIKSTQLYSRSQKYILHSIFFLYIGRNSNELSKIMHFLRLTSNSGPNPECCSFRSRIYSQHFLAQIIM